MITRNEIKIIFLKLLIHVLTQLGLLSVNFRKKQKLMNQYFEK